jgi:DNA-binding IclR family transcriptional regulator
MLMGAIPIYGTFGRWLERDKMLLMSQLNKVLQVLDVFTEERVFATAEEVSGLMRIPRTTAFRYLAQLSEAGLLTKLSGRYSLGPRIIQLDYLMRRSDPLLATAREVMVELGAATGCSVVLSSLYEEQVLNVHHEAGMDTTALTYGRGRTLPLFRGAASKIILAHLTTPRLKAIYENHVGEPDVEAIGTTWESFSEYLRRGRRLGYYLSHEEVDAGVTGIAVPLFNTDRLVTGSLTLVFASKRERLLKTDLLARMLQEAAENVSPPLASRRANRD